MAEERAQRRLAAILAADVVGYSRLMQADEAGTLSALKARRTDILVPLISTHHGRIVKVMGDGVLVEFASAVNAVTCAAELQGAMDAANAGLPEDRRIVLRVGINLGDVMVEGSDLYGDGVNVAARLEALAEPGSVFVSQTVFSHVKGKTKLDFEDLGERNLKNLVEPVRVYRVSGAASVASAFAKIAPSTKPSIAVLPFTNLGEDKELEYFSDGFTEDIITELSRFRNLFVIARNSSFAYRGKSVDVRKVAGELGVEYVLEGSVRRAGQRIRITAQLINAASGNHIWAERYDRELADIFAVQDEVTSNIVGTLAIELEEHSLEQARRKHPGNLLAYEHWLRGKKTSTIPGPGKLEARRHFELAVAADPSFSRAYAGLADTYGTEAGEFLPLDEQREARERSFQYAQKALALDEADCEAHAYIAWCYLYGGDCGQARKHMEQAIRLNPNNADTLANAAFLLALVGEPTAGVRYGETALRLNPHQPDWYLGFLSVALFAARDYPAALAFRLRAPDLFIDSTFFGAAILAHMGRLDEAKRWAERGVVRLSATPAGASAVGEGRVVELLLENNPFCRPEDRDHFAEGMRRAGVPG
jgi:TolB-like protein